MASSPTQRTLEKLRKDGWMPWVVERWLPRVNKRSDLFGFIDILAIKDGEVLAVQATSRSSVSSRVKKIGDHENVAEVRKAGWRIEVWGWGKMANGRWQCRVVDCS